MGYAGAPYTFCRDIPRCIGAADRLDELRRANFGHERPPQCAVRSAGGFGQCSTDRRCGRVHDRAKRSEVQRELRCAQYAGRAHDRVVAVGGAELAQSAPGGARGIISHPQRGARARRSYVCGSVR